MDDEWTCDECGERIGEDDVRHVECHSCHTAFGEVAESDRADVARLTAEATLLSGRVDELRAALKSIAGRTHEGWASDVAKRALGGGQ